MVAMSGCCISHNWQEATCTEPQTCAECGKTKDEALGHTWKEATCAVPKTCTVCGETEGEALEHTWAEATCSAPKTCTVCGATEGKALEHTLTEANYQQAATCEVCGETVGEPVKAYFEECGIKCVTELNKVYDYVTNTHSNNQVKTKAKATFSDFEVFKSDETHKAVDGYEWQAVTVTLIYDDLNNTNYGNAHTVGSWDYYGLRDGVVYFNGKDYPECTHMSDTLKDGVWTGSNRETAVCTYVFRNYYLSPIGYDGNVIFLCDDDALNAMSAGEEEWWNDNTVFFRLKK